MAFIGNTPQTQAFTPAIDYFSGNASTTAFTLSRPVASVAQVQAVISNVPQNPGDAFTVSGNTITFTSAPPSGTNNIYVYYTSPITQVNALSQAPSVLGPMDVGINGAASLAGATNPVVTMNGNSNNYIQSYVYNRSTGTSASSDFTAYPNNGSDASGWVDMGITSSNYSSATYSVTGPNEAYLFGSAPSGAGKTGNLVYATDSTGTTNSHQFYVGGFNQSKSAVKFTVSSTGAYGQLVSGTAVATTSGTSVDYTSIPSWVKRITVLFSGVSLSTTALPIIQIGSGSVETTGYVSYAGYVASGSGSGTATTYFMTRAGSAATGDIIYGIATIALVGSNTWVYSFSGGMTSSGSYGSVAGGTKTTSGTLDRVRITSTNGTDTFDAGSVNILYEG